MVFGYFLTKQKVTKENRGISKFASFLSREKKIKKSVKILNLRFAKFGITKKIE
jgi:hypothetical protein